MKISITSSSFAVLLCLIVVTDCYRLGRNMQMSLQTKSSFSLTLSPLVQNMEVSKTIEIHGITKEMEKNGMTVYSMCVGEPDYQPPSEVISATAEAASKGLTKYTAVNGEADLRKAISQDLKSRKGLEYSPEQIVVSNGAKQSVIQALMAVVSPGDSVLIPAPYWTSYPDMVKICLAKPIAVPTSADDKYTLTAKSLRTALDSNPSTTCLILCNPSNPTGSVMTREDMTAIAQVLEDYPRVAVLCDEIYDRLTYDGKTHSSFATIPSMYDRTITINGFSKAFAMCGYRLGYSASTLPIAKACSKIQSQLTSCASSIAQYAGYRGLSLTKEQWFIDRVLELQNKRDLAYRLLLDIPEVSCPLPDGAFYLLPTISHYYGKRTKSGQLISNSHELALELLKQEQVAVVSGDAFGAPDCIRLSFATSEEIINESMIRLKRFLLSLSD